LDALVIQPPFQPPLHTLAVAYPAQTLRHRLHLTAPYRHHPIAEYRQTQPLPFTKPDEYLQHFTLPAEQFFSVHPATSVCSSHPKIADGPSSFIKTAPSPTQGRGVGVTQTLQGVLEEERVQVALALVVGQKIAQAEVEAAGLTRADS